LEGLSQLQTELGASLGFKKLERYFGKGFEAYVKKYIDRAAAAGFENVFSEDDQIIDMLYNYLHQQSELNEAKQDENLSLPSAIAKISALLDPYLDASVAHHEDGTEEYQDPMVTEQALQSLSKAVDLIQQAFLNMMAGESE
jgi:hypothetical protein